MTILLYRKLDAWRKLWENHTDQSVLFLEPVMTRQVRAEETRAQLLEAAAICFGQEENAKNKQKGE
jgi:hypothetical protein